MHRPLNLLKTWVTSFFISYSKDVSLPQQLQRAMAAEAEASREARAKVSMLGRHGNKPHPRATASPQKKMQDKSLKKKRL